jgi:hypothetical protein
MPGPFFFVKIFGHMPVLVALKILWIIISGITSRAYKYGHGQSTLFL